MPRTIGSSKAEVLDQEQRQHRPLDHLDLRYKQCRGGVGFEVCFEVCFDVGFDVGFEVEFRSGRSRLCAAENGSEMSAV
jgi:hypothetical protein